MELACQQLSVRMFGYSSPQCELFRAERTGSPVMLYQHVDGFNYCARACSHYSFDFHFFF